MTQKERLVELLKDFDKPNEDEWDEEELEFYRDEEAVKELEILYCEQADHLLSRGVIVPPCKVGDKVYFLQRPPYIQKTFVYTGTVARISFVENIEILIYRDVDESFYYREPGHVFATEAEAEQALKQIEEDNDNEMDQNKRTVTAEGLLCSWLCEENH